jgi:hypothetical protein
MERRRDEKLVNLFLIRRWGAGRPDKNLIMEDEAALLVLAEQIRAAQQLADEQVGQQVQQTRSTRQGCMQRSRTISTHKHEEGTQQQQQQQQQQ